MMKILRYIKTYCFYIYTIMNKNISFMFWNVLADGYLKYYDKKYTNSNEKYNYNTFLGPFIINPELRQTRILSHILTMNPDIIGLIEIQKQMYDYLKEKLESNYFFTEIYQDDLDDEKKKFNFPLEGKCVIYKKNLNLQKIQIELIETIYGRKSIDFRFTYINKNFNFIVHHNSPIYMYSVNEKGEYLNPEYNKYNDMYYDSPEHNQIIEIQPGLYKKFIRGGAINSLKMLTDYINNKIDKNNVLVLVGDFNSQPSYPKIDKSHIPTYIEKIKFSMKDLHNYKLDKTLLSSKHDGRRLDYIFYNENMLDIKYCKKITPPIYHINYFKGKNEEVIDKFNIQEIRKQNYYYQIMHFGSDHQFLYGCFYVK
jgi:hypothetical protein